MLSGQDTLRDALSELTPGLDAYGSYVDNFGGFPELLAMRDRLNPHAIYFSYTIFGNPAHFADVEPGAMSPASAARWLRDGRGQPLPGNRVPGIYTSAGNAEALFSAIGIAGLPHDQLPSEFIYQSAHYGAGEHICAPSTCGYRAAHGTQWDNKGPRGENVDRALWLPGVLGEKPVLITIPEDPDMISATTKPDGSVNVFVFVPHAKDDPTKGGTTYVSLTNAPPKGGWVGGEPGKRIAGAYKVASIPEDVV